MKNILLRFLVVAATVASSHAAFAQAGVALPIRNRIQWNENNGYCGETSLQECALYYGIYASQAYIRSIFDPTQKNDLVELEEWALVLGKLGMRADYFPTNLVAEPQYRVFETWAKQQLSRRRPVITGCYYPEGPVSQPLDHILTLTSFITPNLKTYDDNDAFGFNIHWVGPVFFQRAKWFFDAREMNGAGAIYGFALPKEVNYGIAITGSTNQDRRARPVRVEIDRIDEPNLIKGEKPVMLKAEIQVQSLTRGSSYVLYRYNDPAKVPLRNPEQKPADAAAIFKFKATSTAQVISDMISSDGVAIYRCIPGR